jgi:hypothetical protein
VVVVVVVVIADDVEDVEDVVDIVADVDVIEVPVVPLFELLPPLPPLPVVSELEHAARGKAPAKETQTTANAHDFMGDLRVNAEPSLRRGMTRPAALRALSRNPPSNQRAAAARRSGAAVQRFSHCAFTRRFSRIASASGDAFAAAGSASTRTSSTGIAWTRDNTDPPRRMFLL